MNEAHALERIQSRDNPLFKRLLKLADSVSARRETRMTLLDGAHLLAAYLDAGGTPASVVLAESADPAPWASLLARCPQARLVRLSDALMKALAPVKTPTGLLAEAAWLEAPAPPGIPLVVVLDAVQDPGNLGAILRVAAAAGATRAVLGLGCHDPWSPKALRGGQGAQFVLPLETGVNLPDWLRHFDGQTAALAPGAATDLYALDCTGSVAFVVGNEGAGIAAEVLAAARTRVEIPMRGRVESLNAAVAAGIALFEAARQRRVPGRHRQPARV